MTTEDAIQDLKMFIADMHKGKQVTLIPECVGIFEQAVRDIEKQIPKEIDIQGDAQECCPNCGAIVSVYTAGGNYALRYELDYRADYCPCCGQAIARR